jgi:hypothetical protein
MVHAVKFSTQTKWWQKQLWSSEKKKLRRRENESYPIPKNEKQKQKAGKNKESKQPGPIDVGVSKGQFWSSCCLGFHSHIGFV